MKEYIALLLLRIVKKLREDEPWSAERIREGWPLSYSGLPKGESISCKGISYELLHDIKVVPRSKG